MKPAARFEVETHLSRGWTKTFNLILAEKFAFWVSHKIKTYFYLIINAYCVSLQTNGCNFTQTRQTKHFQICAVSKCCVWCWLYDPKMTKGSNISKRCMLAFAYRNDLYQKTEVAANHSLKVKGYCLNLNQGAESHNVCKYELIQVFFNTLKLEIWLFLLLSCSVLNWKQIVY